MDHCTARFTELKGGEPSNGSPPFQRRGFFCRRTEKDPTAAAGGPQKWEVRECICTDEYKEDFDKKIAALGGKP
jgi:hypothetical protein